MLRHIDDVTPIAPTLELWPDANTQPASFLCQSSVVLERHLQQDFKNENLLRFLTDLMFYWGNISKIQWFSIHKVVQYLKSFQFYKTFSSSFGAILSDQKIAKSYKIFLWNSARFNYSVTCISTIIGSSRHPFHWQDKLKISSFFEKIGKYTIFRKFVLQDQPTVSKKTFYSTKIQIFKTILV